LLYPAFLLIMPLLPRPEKVAVRTAAAPSLAQARFMAIATVLMDYVTMGGLILFWDRVCRLDDGSLCPFTAVVSMAASLAVVPIKDEVQCRLLWRKFVSPHKLNSWPYTWKSSLAQLPTVSFLFLSFLSICLDGRVSFEALTTKVVIQGWLESRACLAIADFIMHFAHRWMHEKAYFLHKKHHEGKTDLTSFNSTSFDLLDLILEFGAALPIYLTCKDFLGLDPRIHFLAHSFGLATGIQHHSANPYAVYLFNPLLDYLSRPTLTHNLHHAIQNDYHLFVPWSHFVSPESRHNDIEKYNKQMKTHFPPRV